MAKTYTVTKWDDSKAGAPRIYLDNKHNREDAVYCSKVARPAVGMVVEADMTSSEYPKGSGKMLWHLNAWKEVTPTHLYSSIDPTVNLKAVEAVNDALHRKLKQKEQSGWTMGYDQMLSMVSNVVRGAIDRDLIKRPSDIHPWVATAYSALQGLREGKPIDFEDKFPFGDPVEPGERDNEDDGLGRFSDDPGPEPF